MISIMANGRRGILIIFFFFTIGFDDYYFCDFLDYSF